MRNPQFDIAFGIDDPYLPHVTALIVSIIRHAPGGRFRFIVLHSGIPAARQLMTQSVAPDATFVWVQVTDEIMPSFADRGHFTRTTLFRLGLETLAPSDCHRVLYLDSDMIVLGDIRALFETDLTGVPIGAITDSYVNPIEFSQRWNLPSDVPRYFNAGVLLIDLDLVRAERLFTTALNFVAKHDRDLEFNDQDALNWCCWGRWRLMPLSWNVQRDMVIPTLAARLPEESRFMNRRPKLVHYTGPEKPWVHKGYHPWSWLYWPNIARTPFLDEVIEKENMGYMQRARLCLRWMRRRPSA